MGFLSNLLGKKTAQVLTDLVKDAVSDALSDNGSTFSGSTSAASDNRSFDQKLRSILQNAGVYNIKCNLPAEELEVSVGQTIYTRGSGYRAPEAITYAVYAEGRPTLYIRLWSDYNRYRHTANRQVKQFCDANQIPMLDFFDYMPNEAGYMSGRLMPYLPVA